MATCHCLSDGNSKTYVFIPDTRKIQKSVTKINTSCHPTTESEPLLTFGYYPSSVVNIFWSSSFYNSWLLFSWHTLSPWFDSTFQIFLPLPGYSFSVSIFPSSIFFLPFFFLFLFQSVICKWYYPLGLLFCTLFSTHPILSSRTVSITFWLLLWVVANIFKLQPTPLSL